MAEAPETIRVIMQRQSCRYFLPDEFPQEHLDWILDAMRWAPSGGNTQPWRFHVIRSTEMKLEIAAAAFGQKFVAEAPVIIGVVALPEVSRVQYGDRGADLYCIQDTAAAVQNAMLAATALGLGTCWIGAFDEKLAAKALKLAPNERPLAFIPIGKPKRMGHRTDRKPKNEVVVD